MSHTVKVTMTVPEISKVDTCYEIKENGKKLGSLKISKGGIEYVPKGNSVRTIKKSWVRLHELLTKGLIIYLFIALTACSNKKTYSFEESIPADIKELKQQLLEFEKTPGYEEEKKATRNNLAIGEKAVLETLLIRWELDYTNSEKRSPSNDEKEAFKKSIKYDSIMSSLLQIIKDNKQ